MDIAGMTIEIWEMVIIVFLILTIGYVATTLSDTDKLKANSLSTQIKYIGYLSENTNIETKMDIGEDTKIPEPVGNDIIIEVNGKKSTRKLPKDLVNIKTENNEILITSK